VQRRVPAAAASDRRQTAAVPGAHHETVPVVTVALQFVGRASSPVPASGRGRLLVEPFQFPDEVRFELVGRAERRPAHGTAARRGPGHLLQLLAAAGRGLLLLLLLLDRRPVVVVVAVIVVVVGHGRGGRRPGDGRRAGTAVGRRRRCTGRRHGRRQFLPCGTTKNVVKIEKRRSGQGGRHQPQRRRRRRLRMSRLLRLSSAGEIGHRAADTVGD